jgi:pimeloyl-ACP methyl ester carboxylesterase
MQLTHLTANCTQFNGRLPVEPRLATHPKTPERPSMNEPDAYTPVRKAVSRFESVRGLQAHALVWEGDPALTLRVLLHGWMDVADSFQFLVDASRSQAPTMAIDWRGFGLSRSRADAYWFPDYLGDLDAWLQLISPNAPVDLVGHSMGGNVAMLYGGVRPHRVRRLVNLEGYGLPDSPPDAAPDRLRRWLDELQEPAVLKPYDRLASVASRLCKTNPRLSASKAHWLAQRWSEAQSHGPDNTQWHLKADPAHKRSHASPYRKAEALACWARITAPVLFLEGVDDSLAQFFGTRYPRQDFEDRLQAVPQWVLERVANAGHMLHHDQPEQLAARIDRFLGQSA